MAVPDYLPDTPEVRQDLAEFYGSISVADAAVGRLLDTLAATGLDRTTWVVFMTDHGPALPRAKSTLYDAGTGIAMIVRPPRDAGISPRVYDDLFSGVDLVPTLLDLLGVDVPADIDGISHADNLRHAHSVQARTEVYTTKTYHDSFDPIRAVRTKDYSYIENYAARPLLDLPWDIAESAPGQTVAPLVQTPRPARELYDLTEDPTESTNLLGPRCIRQSRGHRQRPRAAASRVASENQRRHPFGLRGYPNCGALHRDLLANSRTIGDQSVGDRIRTRHRGRADLRTIVFVMVIVNPWCASRFECD